MLARVRSSKHLGRDIPVVGTHAAPTVRRAQVERQGLTADRMLLQEYFRRDTLGDALARLSVGGSRRSATLRSVRCARLSRRRS